MRCLPEGVKEAVIRHAEVCLPNECCGLLATDGVGRIRFAYPLTNSNPSPVAFTIAPEEHFAALRHAERHGWEIGGVAFTIAPEEHFAALRHAERHGWEIGGVFHSHPRGPAVLSETDLSQPHETDWIHVVVGFVPHLDVKGWWIRGGKPVEIPIWS